MLAPATRGARRSVKFHHNSHSKPLGRTNHDLRRVETALKTMVLCEGEELRRGLYGQRVFTVDKPSSAAVSTSVWLPCHTCSFNSA